MSRATFGACHDEIDLAVSSSAAQCRGFYLLERVCLARQYMTSDALLLIWLLGACGRALFSVVPAPRAA